jgi:hypothetical protein
MLFRPPLRPRSYLIRWPFLLDEPVRSPRSPHAKLVETGRHDRPPRDAGPSEASFDGRGDAPIYVLTSAALPSILGRQ